MKRKQVTDSPFSLFAFQDIITSVTGVMLLVTLLLALELVARPTSSPAVNTTRIVAEITSAIEDAEAELERLRSRTNNSPKKVDNTAGYTLFSATEEVRAVEGQIAALEAKTEQLTRQLERLQERLQNLAKRKEERAPDFQRLKALRQQVADLTDELNELEKSNRVFYNPTEAAGEQVYLVELFPEDILVAAVGERAAPIRFSGSSADRDFRNWASTKSTSGVRFVLLPHPGTTHIFDRLYDGLETIGFAIGYDLLPSGKRAIDLETGAE